MKFKDIKIGQIFSHNGTKWIKKSTRTAKLYEGEAIYYFSKNEEIYSW